jgi:hypothetical protein
MSYECRLVLSTDRRAETILFDIQTPHFVAQNTSRRPFATFRPVPGIAAVPRLIQAESLGDAWMKESSRIAKTIQRHVATVQYLHFSSKQ